MKVFVFGSNGMLGRYVYSYFKLQNYEVVGLTRQDLDLVTASIKSTEDVLLSKGMTAGDVVINCAGLIKQRGNTKDADFIAVNAIFPHKLNKVCTANRCNLIHVTTDCFLPNTKILTDDGYRCIEDIYVNDLIYTHTGNLKKVTEVLVKYVEEEVFTIKTLGNDEIRCTKSHPWYGIKRHYKESVDFETIKWLKTEDLNVGCLIAIPKIKLPKQTVNTIDLFKYSIVYKNIYDEYMFFLNNIKPFDLNIKKYCVENNLNYRKIIKWNKYSDIKPDIFKYDNVINLNEDLMWLLGIFLAEGWVNNKTSRKSVTLAFGDEPDLINKTCSIIKKELGVTPYKRNLKKQKGYQVIFTHPLLSEFLSQDFYTCNDKYSHTKKIPQWIKDTGKDNIVSFIRGYFDGDGCFFHNTKSAIIKMASVSESLIDELKVLLMMIDVFACKSSTEKRYSVIYGREVNSKPLYTLSIAGRQLRILLDYFNIACELCIRPYNKFFEDTDYWYIPVTEVSKTKYSGMVFNLEVEDNHSYLVNGGASVHNCVYDGLKGGYNEYSEQDALDTYGFTKSIGEPSTATVIRTSIIGEELNNFSSLLEWVKSNKGKEIRGYINHRWNGITCLQFAKICKIIIDNDLYWPGVHHITSPYAVSKYELTKMISDVYELDITVVPFETDVICDRTMTTVFRSFDIPPLKDQLIEMKEFYNTLKG